MVLSLPVATAADLADLAVAEIRRAGCEYGDIRLCVDRRQQLTARDRSLSGLADRVSAGFGVRVLHRGAWGFAASPTRTPAAVRQAVAQAVAIAEGSRRSRREPVQLVPVAAYRDRYETPIARDPFAVPLETQTELLLELTDRLLAWGDRGVKKAWASLRFDRSEKYFASTVGSQIEQLLYRAHAAMGCTAIADGDAQSRSYERPPLNCGYEQADPDDLRAQCDRLAAEAAEKVRAPEMESGRKTLLLKPSHLYLTIHESVGHPTELDRVFGYEANFAGTSFATPDRLGMQYAAPWVNFKADRLQPRGRSTCGYDDDGVPAQSWYVVKDGRLCDYLTDRETAHRLGRAASNGCAYADSWASLPMVRIPNLSLEPGPDGGPQTATLAEAIADTEDGLLIDGTGSFSIDQQRRNFQFGGDAFWRVKNGKLAGMVKNATYRSTTPEFWNSVDALGPASEWEPHGTAFCGKGEPIQIAQMTHGCVPVRVRDVPVND